MQRHIECPGVLGNLGLDRLSLCFRDLCTDRLVAPPSSGQSSRRTAVVRRIAGRIGPSCQPSSFAFTLAHGLDSPALGGA
jgi:hypothetical protein